MEGLNQPLLELCWLQGFRASQKGEEEEGNPYPRHSKEAHYWQEGYWEGLFNECSTQPQ